MDDPDGLAARFAEHRHHLRAVAYRMLGSASEADDAVQEAWLKTARAATGEVDNLRGWLTTVVARVCLDFLRARKARPTEPLAEHAATATDLGPALGGSELAIADAIGPALQIVLDTLTPAERVAFVLHDLFDLPFEAIGPIIDRTPAAARQLASRGRRRVRGGGASDGERGGDHQGLVSAFLAASRDGDFAGLVAVLSPGVIMRADALSVQTAASGRKGAPELAPEVRGAPAVAEVFKGRARGAKPALIDGVPGAVWVMGGEIRAAFVFGFDGDRIGAIDLVMDPDHLAALDVELAPA